MGPLAANRRDVVPHARGPIAFALLRHVSRGAVRGLRGAGTRGPRTVGRGDEPAERPQHPQESARGHGGTQGGAAASPRLLPIPGPDRRVAAAACP